MRLLTPSALLCLFLALPLAAQAAHHRANAVARTEAGNDYYAGGEVVLDGAVQGDLFAAGGRVRVQRPVGADAAVAGGSVEIMSNVGQDLRVAGGDVTISNAVDGELAAAGGSVKITDSATVAGAALLAGGNVTVDGRLGKGARIYAGEVFLNGEIDGDTRLYAREITLGPNARIDGNLYYTSAAPLPEEQLGKISGRVIRERTPEGWTVSTARRGTTWFHPVFFFSMLVCGFVLWLLFPNALAGVAATIATAPLRSLGIGLALFFALPPVAILLMITIIGLPAGISLFLLYPLFLMLGYLAAAFAIGRKLANAAGQPAELGKTRQALFLAAALLVLALVRVVPVLGWLLVFLALVAGIGGWVVWAFRRYRGPGAGAPASPATTPSSTPSTLS
jgi:cytoskeletal protein CcmA (bactofilin family)